MFKDDVTVDWSIISDDKELDVLGAHLGPNCWPAAIKIIESGVLPHRRDLHAPVRARMTSRRPWTHVADSAGASIKVSILPGT